MLWQTSFLSHPDLFQHLRGGTLLRTAPHSEAVQSPRSQAEGEQRLSGLGCVAAASGARIQVPRMIEHNGNLATFHADAVLLPEKGYGIVLLYNDDYMLSSFDTIKQGVIDLLLGKQPSAGSWNVSIISGMLATLTLLTVVVQVRSLLRLPRWAVKTKNTSAWRHVPGVVWAFTPAVLLITFQRLTAAFTGRMFGYAHLFFSLPDIMAWVGLSAVLGTSLGMARIALMELSMGFTAISEAIESLTTSYDATATGFVDVLH